MDTYLARARVPYPVEIEAPDIAPYARGNTGVPYFTTFDSGLDGPHVMVVGLVHGNEVCGALAVDRLFREAVRPARGRLTLGLANVAAYARFDADDPMASRYVDEDLNRLWETGVLDSKRSSVELERAREMRPLIATADALLDLHSMQHPSEPLALAGLTEKGRRFALSLGFPRLVVADAGHAAGRRMRDHSAFAMPENARNAILVECGQHWAEATAGVAIETALRFLDALGVIDPAFAAERLPAEPLAPQRVIEVTDAITVQTNDFRFAAPYLGLEVIAKAGTLIGRDGPHAVRTPYDECVLIMPSRRLQRGQTAVRLGRFVV